MKRTYAQFVEFVKAQPADKTINHDQGWRHCSVGEFVGGTIVEAETFAKDVLKEENRELHDNLNHAPTARIRFPTYGALAEAL